MRIMSVWVQIAIRCWGLTAASDDGDNRVQHPAVARERAPSKILLKPENNMLMVGDDSMVLSLPWVDERMKDGSN